MAHDGKVGGGGNRRDAIHEKFAKKLEKAAEACRVQKGGLDCLKMDVEAAVVRNASAIADALLRDAGGGLGAHRAPALAATVESDVAPKQCGPSMPETKGAAPSAPTAVSGAVEVEESPAVLNAIAEPAAAPVAKMEEPDDDCG